ncbi:RNA polymerase sigma factor [Bacillus sp. SD088]|uniref:RNA polymerase sigma factor n=2 Tax=Bacillaceae TaxID=186817 RepID=UPI001A958156|nr:sigma-70 family RNA polymerase sigma factor [Bacillus sp. SD088]MBO0994608.1 sigma-70 family RNA polymerase sigma factor [Bacillus sp. SD088]
MIAPNRTEWQIRCAFNAFCKRVLKNAAIDIYKERKRQRSKEKTFSDLTPYEANQLYSVDNYGEGNKEGFQIVDKKITTKLLAEAMHSLSEEKRNLVLLYYFLHLSDEEISQQLNVPRRTVHYRRTSALKRLKRFLEEHANEWDE